MKLSSIKKHHLAIVTAGIVLAWGANLAIMKSGGYDWTNAPVFISLAMAVFVGSLVAADAFKSGTAAAVVLVIGLLANETFNLGTTGEATLFARAEATAPLKKQKQQRADALAELDRAEKSEPTSARLTMAKDALVAAKVSNRTEAVEFADKALQKAKDDVKIEAKNIACKKECWRLQDLADAAQRNLDAALFDAEAQRATRVASAEAEVQAALTEAVTLRAAAIEAAKRMVEANPEPTISATLFADTVGWASWVVDLLFAGARSIAINFSAAGLIAYAAQKMSEESDKERVRTMLQGVIPDPDHNRPTVRSVIGRGKPSSDNRNGPNGRGGSQGPTKRGPGGPSGNTVKERLFDDVMQHILDKRPIPSQQYLADKHDAPKTSVSDWMRDWRDEGLIPKATKVGRCNAIA